MSRINLIHNYMFTLLCLFLPPMAILLKGKPSAFILNILLCLLGWFPGVIHAFIIVGQANAENRHKETLKEMKKQTSALLNAQKQNNQSNGI